MDEKRLVCHDSDKAKTVSVSEDYLAFLHDELSENRVRLREILGESQANALFCWSADRLVTTLGSSRNALSPVEGIAQTLKSWGMQVEVKSKGNTVDISMKCPYAETVHPRLSSKEPKCPLAEYLLGAVRLEDSKSQLLRNDLTKDGVQLKFEKQSD